jgi:glycoprotein 3-alpha-L-fucosyltransferase
MKLTRVYFAILFLFNCFLTFVLFFKLFSANIEINKLKQSLVQMRTSQVRTFSHVHVRNITASNSSKLPKHADSKLIFVKWSRFKLSSFKKCEFRCHATVDTSLLKNADAVIVDGWNQESIVRTKDSTNQRWIFLLNESPRTSFEIVRNFSSKKFNNMFNWTVSYVKDSDFRMRFWKFLAQTDKSKTVFDYAANKTKFALAAISHCYNKQRLALIKEMQKYAPKLIDFYGKCGDCNKSKNNPCDFNFKDYKFFLAYENSEYCKDYITEKFFRNALQNEVVPIAYGARKIDYLTNIPFMPSHSFIHVDDFPNTKALVEYMLYLHQQPQKYNEYHKWRQTHVLVNNSENIPCSICKRLHLDRSEKSYADFESWFNTCENFYV